jgi:geranylgeranyl pyrophosphate synthase
VQKKATTSAVALGIRQQKDVRKLKNINTKNKNINIKTIPLIRANKGYKETKNRIKKWRREAPKCLM